MLPAKLKHHLSSAPHYFALLGVHLESTQVEIDTARRALAAQVHPDKHPDDGDTAHALMAVINVAHGALCNGRAAYAASIGRGTCHPCRGRGCTVKRRGFSQVIITACPHCQGSGRKL